MVGLGGGASTSTVGSKGTRLRCRSPGVIMVAQKILVELGGWVWDLELVTPTTVTCYSVRNATLVWSTGK